MKKSVAVLLPLSLLFVLSACGSDPSSGLSGTTIQAALSRETTTSSTTGATTAADTSPTVAANDVDILTTVTRPRTQTAAATTTRPQGPQTLPLSSLKGQYKAQGRSNLTDDGLWMDWTASSFEFNANCKGDVALTMESAADEPIYFTILVDGKEQPRTFTIKGKHTVTVATGLASGRHSFQIYRQSEAKKGALTITALTLDGELLAPPTNNDLLIEFVGDSLTAGYGNLGDASTSNAGSSEYQDGYQTYAAITARNLNADYQIEAFSSWGVVSGTISKEDKVPKTYGYTSYFRDNTRWSFERPADVVVVVLGSNDKWSGAAYDDYVNGLRDFTAVIREKNPGAKIVLNCTQYNSETIVEELGSEKNSLYAYELPFGTWNGGSNHPDLQNHRAAAEGLTQFLKKLGY